jgi:glutamate racemase
MARIAVFDSGFGSLSVIRSIQKFTKSEIIYFADQKNFPYGSKKSPQLKKIIGNTITKLEKSFAPDIIVMASNTPSILFPDYLNRRVIGVLPPLVHASRLTKTSCVGILATQAAIKSRALSNHIRKSSPHIQVKKINASKLIELVENGKFLTDQKYCARIIKSVLGKALTDNNIDVVTLSSTHLPFLLPILKKEFPHVRFLDPADDVARKIAKITKRSKQNKLTIYSSKNPKTFQKHLRMIGIKNKISFLP